MIQAMNALAPTRVMVVDDDAGYARLLVDCFSGLGFEVLYVESGALALAAVAGFHPEIILLDIRMPEMDGFEVCQSIRKNPQYASIIIIMLTSVGEVEDKIKGIDIGANDYVVKPFGLSELFEVVARVNRFLDTKGGYLRKVEEEKFTTLRGAANTVCHEINNPLTAIVGATRVLNMKLAERGDADRASGGNQEYPRGSPPHPEHHPSVGPGDPRRHDRACPRNQDDRPQSLR